MLISSVVWQEISTHVKYVKCIWNIYQYLSKLQITTKSPIPNNVVKSSWTGMAQIISFPNQFSARCSVLLLTMLYLKTSCPRYRTIRIIQCGIHPYRKKAAFRGWNNPQWRILRNVSTENCLFCFKNLQSLFFEFLFIPHQESNRPI